MGLRRIGDLCTILSTFYVAMFLIVLDLLGWKEGSKRIQRKFLKARILRILNRDSWSQESSLKPFKGDSFESSFSGIRRGRRWWVSLSLPPAFISGFLNFLFHRWSGNVIFVLVSMCFHLFESISINYVDIFISAIDFQWIDYY